MKKWLDWLHPPPKDLTEVWQKHHHAPVSRADLLWAMFALPDAQHAQMAALLGFEARQDEPVAPSPALPSPKRQHPRRPKLILPDEPITAPDPIEPSFARYEVIELPTAAVPDWAKGTDLFTLTGSRIPAAHQIPLLSPPLTPWARLLPVLHRVLGAQQASLRPDMTALVAQVARGKIVARLPRQHRHTWTPELRVLLDINEGNFAFRHDFFALRDKLTAMRGADGLEVQYIDDHPAGNVLSYHNGQRTRSRWQPPAQGTPLLIVSDLGCHRPSRRTLLQWLAFGQTLRVRGIRPTVLMPVAARAIDPRLLVDFDCLVWDRTSRLKPVRGDTPPDGRDHAAVLDNFLSLFFAGVRLSSGLVRSVRHLLPANVYDVGHEAALWQHSAVNAAGDEWGWQTDSKARYVALAKTCLKQLTAAQQQQLIAAMAQSHAVFPDELYFEAINGLVLLGLPVPAALQTLSAQFMQDLLATYYQQPDNALLAGWVNRHLARHQADALRSQYQYGHKFFACRLLHEQTRHPAAPIKLPNTLSAPEQQQILDLLHHRWTVRQSFAPLSIFQDRFLNGSGNAPEMVVIPAGRFTMGWVEGRDGEGYNDEKPAHPVNVPRFAIGKYPVTQAQWQAVMGSNPSRFTENGTNCPVERVSWDDAQKFIRKLNKMTGKQYRLPSEAEWEYACRGGGNHQYAGSNDVDAVAWYTKNSGDKTHPVGGKQANAFGLYDMSGNVSEWVQDSKHGDYNGAPSDGSAWEGSRAEARVLRGGSWYDFPRSVRAAYRINNPAADRFIVIGFRLARTLP